LQAFRQLPVITSPCRLQTRPAKPQATDRPFVRYSSLRAASIMAKMPARSAAGNVGQASINRRRSGPIWFLLLIVLRAVDCSSSQDVIELEFAESHWGLKIPWPVRAVPVRVRPRLVSWRVGLRAPI